MGARLDLDDVAAGHPFALEELAALRLAHRRYEIARRMNPRQWAEAWSRNLDGRQPFDEIIDEYGRLYAPRSDAPHG